METKKIKCLYRCEMCGNSFQVTHEIEKEEMISLDDFVIEFLTEPHKQCISQIGFIGIGKLVATEDAF